MKGGRIGTVEESFISRLKPGQAFLLGGRLLALKRVREMTAYVERAKPGTAAVPRWQGGRSPLSTELSRAVVDMLDRARDGDRSEPELAAVSRLLELQQRWSVLPSSGELLVETTDTREGHHLFCFPFAGRLVHTGLASLFGYRASRSLPNTFSIAVSDYGFELLSPVPVDWHRAFEGDLLDAQGLDEDLLASLNAGELARRQFREIARVAGLIFMGFPGQPKRARELQASAGLLHDVFERHDPENLLLMQSRAEVMRDELDIVRLRATLAQMRAQTLRLVHASHVTPFAFPLLAARIREKVSTEKVGDRIARMVAELERAAARGD
jgi:ATP-dependent Lhr-like helicase